jgi:uncharacterized membrane protein
MKEMGKVGAAGQGRILSIDILRGIAVICMVLVHFPAILFLAGHAPGDFGYAASWLVLVVCNNFTFALFMIASGMAVSLSVHRKRGRGVGESQILTHEIWRCMLLILVGFAFTFQMTYRQYGFHWLVILGWAVLHNIGVAGLVTYFLSKTRIRYQLLTAALIFILTPLLQMAFSVYNLETYIALGKSSPALYYLAHLFLVSLGSTFPMLPWIGFGVLGCALGSLLARGEIMRSIPYQLGIGIAFVLLSQLLPRITGLAALPVLGGMGPEHMYPPSLFFVLSAIGINLLICSLIFFLGNKFNLSSGRWKLPSHYVVTCGQSALMIYIIHYFFVFRFGAIALGLYGKLNFLQMVVATLFYLVFQYFLSRGWIDFLRGRKFRYFELCFWLAFCIITELMLIGVGL